jgi:hypothetical protein
MDSTAIGEAVGKAPTWTRRESGRWSERHRRGPDDSGGIEAAEERAHRWWRNDTVRVRVYVAAV